MKKLAGAISAIVLMAMIGRAQDTGRIDWPRYQDMAVELMQQYLRVNTSNPPGNEIEAARFLKKIFDQHGIENEIFEYKPDRANIIAEQRMAAPHQRRRKGRLPRSARAGKDYGLAIQKHA